MSLYKQKDRTEAFEEGYKLAKEYKKAILFREKPPTVSNPYELRSDDWYDFENGYMHGVSK